MLLSICRDPKLQGKKVVLVLDNARIHHHQFVLECARRHKVNVIFLAQYSPWLNPVESLFAFIKSKLTPTQLATR